MRKRHLNNNDVETQIYFMQCSATAKCMNNDKPNDERGQDSWQRWLQSNINCIDIMYAQLSKGPLSQLYFAETKIMVVFI